MTIVKLTDNTIINAETVEIVNGVLRIKTNDFTVEELDALFSDKEKTNNLTLLTTSGKVSGYQKGFTSFAGIHYDSDGAKTIELFQPVDITEARISNLEGATAEASVIASEHENTMNALLGV